MRFAIGLLACTVCAVTALAAPSARANGRFPTAQQIAPSPTDPSLIAMMATFGVVLSRDNGASWDWACEQAVGYQSNENPVLGITQANTILVGAFEGLGSTTDRGCSWSFASSGIADPVVDLVVEPSDTHSALVISSGYLGQDDSGSSFTTRLWATHDDGAHYLQVGPPIDRDIIPETVDVAPSDATRVYVSGTRRKNGVAYGVLLRSSDAGQTFAETDFPLVTGDGGLIDRAPFIAAVDPTNADRVYVRVQNIRGTRLLVSDDGLVTMRQVWQAQGDLLGFVLSADGRTVYVGGQNDGLHVASSQTLDFTAQRWPGQVQCLIFQGKRLLACSNEVSGFLVGASTDDGASWTPLLHLSCVRGPLSCAASSPVTTTCAPNWAAQQKTLGGPDPTCAGDAGAVDASDASSAGDAAPRPMGPAMPQVKGGCSSSPQADDALPLAGAGLAVCWILAWRRRRLR